MKELLPEVQFVYMCGFDEGYDSLNSDGFSSLDCDLVRCWWKAPIYGIGFIYGKIKKVFVRQNRI